MARPRKQRSPDLPVPAMSTERQPDESDTDYYLRVLPRPPLTLSAHDDIVADWVERVFRAGGIQAIEWVFDTGNWPLGSIARGRMLHFLGVLRQRVENEHRQHQRDEERARQHNAEDERRRARREAGWA